MGIKNLNKIITKYFSSAFTEDTDLSDFAYKKIAIDTSLYLYKYKAIGGSTWLQCFISLISCLRRNNIHCVFIYDNGSPIEKTGEKLKRADARKNLEEKIIDIEKAIDYFRETGVVKSILQNIVEKQNSERLIKKKSFSIELAEKEIEKIRNQIINVSLDDLNDTKLLFEIMGIPYYIAPLEAETMCADLCKRGIVDAVLSDDTDIIAYSSPICLTKLNIYTSKCTKLDFNKLMEVSGLTESEILDLCILLGTDYNTNVYGIGPEKSLKHIQSGKSVIQASGKEPLPFDYKRIREIFQDYERSEITYVPYCDKPDFEKLKEFMIFHNIKLKVSEIEKNFIADIELTE